MRKESLRKGSERAAQKFKEIVEELSKKIRDSSSAGIRKMSSSMRLPVHRKFNMAFENRARRVSLPFGQSKRSRVVSYDTVEAADRGLLEFISYEYPDMTPEALQAMATPSAAVNSRPNEKDLKALIHPETFEIRVWYFLLSVLCMLQGFYVSFASAFPSTETNFSYVFSFLVGVFLCFDIILSLMTSYRSSNGLFEFRLSNVILNYLTTWCIVDICAIVALMVHPPKISVSAAYNASSSGVVTSGSYPIPYNFLTPWKFFRIFFLVLQVLKQMIFRKLGIGKIQNAKISTFVFVLKLSLFFFLCIHWATIVFFFITQDPNSTWFINQLREKDNNSVFVIYTVYFTGAFSILAGRHSVLSTTLEKWFAFLASVIGLMFQAYLLGEVTLVLQKMNARVTKWRIASDELNDSMNNMKLGKSLQRRLKNAYAYWWAVHGSQNRKIEWLYTISKELRTEVFLQVNKQLLEKVPLFKDGSEAFLIAVTETLETELYLPGGYVIIYGELGKEMYFIVHGTLQAMDEKERIVYAIMGPGMFFGEIALLDENAKRTATVRSYTYSQVSILTRQALDSVMQIFPNSNELQSLRQAAAERQANTKKVEDFEAKKHRKAALKR